MAVWVFQWEVLIIVAIIWIVVFLILKNFSTSVWKDDNKISYSKVSVLLIPFFMIVSGFVFETDEICVESIETWQETVGIFTTTNYYALINNEVKVRMKHPFEIKEGDCLILQQKIFSGYHVKPAPFWYS
jgi:hypothetical protein